MALTIPKKGRVYGRATHVYEFFDLRVLGHLWFIAVNEGEMVQMLAPTFRSEQAARIFEHCYLYYPGEFLLSIDGQLELAARIERRLAHGGIAEESALELLSEEFERERAEVAATK
jgi:hypothetical protein